DELRPTRRGRLHRRVAETIEELHASSIESHLGELAHHFGRAGDEEKTIEYACRAGDYALTQLAHDEAAAYFDHARELLQELDAEPERLGNLLLRLGIAQRRAGEPVYRETLLEAASLAERVGSSATRRRSRTCLWLVCSRCGNLARSRSGLRSAPTSSRSPSSSVTRTSSSLRPTTGSRRAWKPVAAPRPTKPWGVWHASPPSSDK